MPPQRPQRPQRPGLPSGSLQRQGAKATYLTLRDHGKVFVADLPRLSDGQLIQVAREARDVLESLERRLGELTNHPSQEQPDNDMRIRAATKRDVTERFLLAINEEQTLRSNNPALRAAAGESLARAFLELARQRLPAATFDALLQEALETSGSDAEVPPDTSGRRVIPIVRRADDPTEQAPLPVVLTPDTLAQAV